MSQGGTRLLTSVSVCARVKCKFNIKRSVRAIFTCDCKQHTSNQIDYRLPIDDQEQKTTLHTNHTHSYNIQHVALSFIKNITTHTHMTKSHGSCVFWRVYGVWSCVLIRVSQQFVLHLMCGGWLMYWCCCYCFLIGAYRAKAFTPKCCIVVIIVAGACLQAKQIVLHC